VKPEQPSPEPPPAKKIDLAAMLKDAEARLTESQTRLKQAISPRIPFTRNMKSRPTETQTRPVEPHVAPAAAKDMGAHPAETQIQPPAEPYVAPAATKDTEAHPAQVQPPAEPDANLVAALKDTEARLAETEKRAQEHHDAWLRAKAETENMRRRAQEEVAKASKFAAEKFAGTMLPVKDSLETALAIEGQTLESLREGVELTLRQLVGAFDAASLTEENPLGQKFDPNKHQAIGVIESEVEPNTVINVLQKGYLLHGRVIRPAMVMVSKAKT